MFFRWLQKVKTWWLIYMDQNKRFWLFRKIDFILKFSQKLIILIFFWLRTPYYQAQNHQKKQPVGVPHHLLLNNPVVPVGLPNHLLLNNPVVPGGILHQLLLSHLVVVGVNRLNHQNCLQAGENKLNPSKIQRLAGEMYLKKNQSKMFLKKFLKKVFWKFLQL